MMVSLFKPLAVCRVVMACVLLGFSLPVFGANPVANDDTYVVDADGNVSVRASYFTTMKAQDPSLYWNMDDLSDANITRAGGVDGANFQFTALASINQIAAPVLGPAGGFKGFTTDNRWVEINRNGNGYFSAIVNPKTLLFFINYIILWENAAKPRKKMGVFTGNNDIVPVQNIIFSYCK